MKITPLGFQSNQSARQRTNMAKNPSFGVIFTPEFLRAVKEMVPHPDRNLASANKIGEKIYKLVHDLSERSDDLTVCGVFYPEYTGINYKTGEVVTRQAKFVLESDRELKNSSEILEQLERLDSATKSIKPKKGP